MDKDKFLQEMRERFRVAQGADSDERNLALEDMRFVLGGENQWDDDALKARQGRPVITSNKLPKFIRQVTGDQRQNRPSIKVRPVDSQADPEIAKIYEGHIRNIEYNSSASFAYDNAFKQAVTGGYPGWWRILTDYSDDDSFEQDVKIVPVHNQFTVYPDPETIHEVYEGKLAWCFIVDTISDAAFKKLVGDSDVSGDFEQGTGEEMEGWNLEGVRRIAEYFYREPVDRVIYRTENGEVYGSEKVDEFIIETAEGKIIQWEDGQVSRIVKERKVKTHKVMWCKVTGDKIIEGPKEVAGKYIGMVPVFGDTWNIAGETHYKSIIRDAKDPQRVYNYMVSQNVEMAALQPKTPFTLTPDQIKGHETQWNQLNAVAYPYVLYNPDPRAGGPPKRNPGPMTNPAYIQMAQQATDDMKDCTGIYDASVGQKSNETSGKAILARQREGDVGMFEFIDNLTRAIHFTGKILVDLIPRIYDTERTLRTLGVDESPEMVEINKTYISKDGEKIIINDITVGKYDVYVSVGPSYTTQRMEAAEAMQTILQAVPIAAPVLLPRLVKAMDWADAGDIATELKQLFQPQEQTQPGQPQLPAGQPIQVPGMPQQQPMPGNGQMVPPT